MKTILLLNWLDFTESGSAIQLFKVISTFKENEKKESKECPEIVGTPQKSKKLDIKRLEKGPLTTQSKKQQPQLIWQNVDPN